MRPLIWIGILVLWLFLAWLILGMLRLSAEADRQAKAAFHALMKRKEETDGQE